MRLQRVAARLEAIVGRLAAELREGESSGTPFT